MTGIEEMGSMAASMRNRCLKHSWWPFSNRSETLAQDERLHKHTDIHTRSRMWKERVALGHKLNNWTESWLRPHSLGYDCGTGSDPGCTYIVIGSKAAVFVPPESNLSDKQDKSFLSLPGFPKKAHCFKQNTKEKSLYQNKLNCFNSRRLIILCKSIPI